MLNTNDSQSIEWFIDEKIKPLKKEIKKLQLENKELNEKFSLYGVVASLPSKDEMYLRELQEFKEVVKIDAAVSRIDFGAGFVKCYNWMVESRKSKG